MQTPIKLNLITKALLVLAIFIFISCKNEIENPLVSGTDFCSKIHANKEYSSLSRELNELDTLMQSKTGVYVLEDGAGSMVTRAWLTEQAEKTITFNILSSLQTT